MLTQRDHTATTELQQIFRLIIWALLLSEARGKLSESAVLYFWKIVAVE